GGPWVVSEGLPWPCATRQDPGARSRDEPTSGVDPLTRREFWQHINAMVEQGVTVMVTTHFLDEAEYCDRIGLVYRGRIIAEGSPDELKDQARSDGHQEPTLEDAFITLVEHFDQQEAREEPSLDHPPFLTPRREFPKNPDPRLFCGTLGGSRHKRPVRAAPLLVNDASESPGAIAFDSRDRHRRPP